MSGSAMDIDPVPGPSSAPDYPIPQPAEAQAGTSSNRTSEQQNQHMESSTETSINQSTRDYRIALFNLYKRTLRLSKKNKKKMLDMYCGNGRDLIRLMESGFGDYFERVVGADSSLAAITLAKAIPTTFNNIEFKVLDLNETNFTWSEQYHVITCFYDLDIVNDMQRGFERIYNMMEPDGCLLMTMVVESPLHDIIRTMLREDKWRRKLAKRRLPRAIPERSRFLVSEIDDILEGMGFSLLHVREKKELYKYTDAKLLKDKIRSLNILQYDIARHDKTTFYSDVFDRMRKAGLMEESTDPNGLVYKIPLTLVHITARRIQSAEQYLVQYTKKKRAEDAGERVDDDGDSSEDDDGTFKEFEAIPKDDVTWDNRVSELLTALNFTG